MIFNSIYFFTSLNQYSVLLIWTVYANLDDYNDDYDYTYYDLEPEENAIAYNNSYTDCLLDDQYTIRCNITLTKENLFEYANIWYSPLLKNSTFSFELKCVSCDLETFPNEITNNGVPWRTLNFGNSNIKQLKMNATNTTVANTIRSLYLYNNFITHLDDESFPTSYSLFELDLSHNLIVSVTGNSTFNKMKFLISIKLSYNFITQLDPLVFNKLSHLMRLDLNYNMLMETSFAGYLDEYRTSLTLSNNPIVKLEKNINVRELVLRNTSLTNCSIGSSVLSLIIVNGTLETIDLSNATSLSLVNLSSNHLIYFEYKNAEPLVILDLYNNRLQVIKVGNTRTLCSINLARNNITNMFNVKLPNNISDLNLSHNKITNLEEETFKSLIHLTVLNLAHCGLHTLNADIFIPLQVLQSLDLSYNRIVNLDLKIFKGLQRLAQLNLNGNRLSDINVEDLTNSIKLIEISNNDWKCTRLKVIIDILNRRNAIRFHEPCNKMSCQENIHGIACRNDEFLADLNSTEASNEDSEADDRFRDKENHFWKKVHANITIQSPDTIDNQNLTSIIHEINQDLHNILKDIQMQRIIKNPDNYTVLGSDTQSMNTLNHSIANGFRKISERVERLRKIADGFLMGVTNITDTEANEDAMISATTEGPKDYQSTTPAIVSIIIVILVVFVAAAIYIVVLKLRKRRAQRFDLIASYSEAH